jgi:mycothiol synthase
VTARVEEVDAKTAPEETLRTIVRIEERCVSQEGRTEDDAVLFMRHPPAGDRRYHWLAFEANEAVGMMRLIAPPGSSLMWSHLRVLPERRRHGVGRALLAAAFEVAGDRPIGGHHQSPEGAAFAHAVGARDEQRDVQSELDLRAAQLPEALLPDGYELRSWIGAAPDELVASFASARNAIDDAPSPEGQTLAVWTVELVRELEETIERRGRELRVTIALAGNEVVAFTEIRVSAPPSWMANTEDTATVAEHRGKGLSQAVKTESLRRLKADRPDVETVGTLNAESNRAMRAVNTKLGFVPVATLTTAVLRHP